jgi:hypothetical protein
VCYNRSLSTPSIPNGGEFDQEKPPLVIPERPAREPAWGLIDVLVLGAGIFVVINLLAAIFLVPMLIAMNLPHGQSPPLTVVAKAAIPAELLAYVFLIICVKVVLSERGHPHLLKAVGWNWPSAPRALALVMLGVLSAFVANAVSTHIDIPADAPILEMMKDRVVVEMFLVFGIVVAPFAEEFYFRGLLYPALQRRIGTVASVLITAVLFALMHASQLANSLGPVFILFSVGVLLTVVRARTGSLAASFLVHIAYNSTLFLGSVFFR